MKKTKLKKKKYKKKFRKTRRKCVSFKDYDDMILEALLLKAYNTIHSSYSYHTGFHLVVEVSLCSGFISDQSGNLSYKLSFLR